MRPLKRSVDRSRLVNDRQKLRLTSKQPAMISDAKYTVGLLNLCDELVLKIFQYLPHDSLVSMSLVHPSLSKISKDWTLWKRLRFDTINLSIENMCTSQLNDLVTHIDIKSDKVSSFQSSVSQRFMVQIKAKCPKLIHLGLYKQLFDAIKINSIILQKTLKTLIIEHSVLKNPHISSFLFNIDFVCPDLEDVRLNFNHWFYPFNLSALARLQNLTYLSLQGCCKLIHFSTYVSALTNDGFKCLRTLDLRFTPVNDYTLLCFQRLKNLKHVLLEKPVGSYGFDTITDYGVTGFCNVINEINPIDVVKCKIENVYVRNYSLVTDYFLREAVSCSFIQCLDVTGTACTINEIEKFKVQRPNVKIVY